MSIGRHLRQYFVAYRKRVLMKPCRAAALLAFALAALFLSGAAPKASADTCRHTDVVFYTSDTTRLATELSKSASPCADYYLLITSDSGPPRGGTPVTTIHSLGTRFHAMSEIKLNYWATYAASYASTHGGIRASLGTQPGSRPGRRCAMLATTLRSGMLGRLTRSVHRQARRWASTY